MDGNIKILKICDILENFFQATNYFLISINSNRA